MRVSPERAAADPAAGRVRRLRLAFERLLAVPQDERRDAAQRRFGADPAFLREVLRLVDCDVGERFLEPPSRTGEVPSAAPEPDAAPGRLLAHRWRLVRRIGSGAQGVVWEAEDVFGGHRVVVKLLRPADRPAIETMGRESAVLRWLRLPGVVGFLGDGRDGRCFWIAMEYVAGEPFPGRAGAGGWDRVEPVFVGLLEALARVHGAGVIHGDIKPQNVLVGADGVVTLLDLGLATRLGGGAEPMVGGTPGYTAPEHFRGAAPDVRSDLYSVGVLAFNALARRAGRGAARRTLPRRGIPSRVRRLISRLLATDPLARPASAADALRLLRPPRAARRALSWTEAELRGRFLGHDWFHHLREDAARELFRRTGGDPSQVEDELASWMRAGLARIEHGLVAMDRVGLDRLALMAAGPQPAARRSGPAQRSSADAELAVALRTQDPRRVVRAALRAGRAALAVGAGGHALSALEIGSAAAQGAGLVGEHRRVLLLAASGALATATAREIERALWLVQRSALRDAHAEALRDTLRAAAAFQTGDRETAFALASRAARGAPASVRPVAWSVRALIAQSLDLDVQRRVVAQGAAWARRTRTPHARRAHRTWRAWLAYRTGRCGDAARLHLLNVRATVHRAESLRSLVDAAVAAKDGGDEATAIRLASSARQRAARLRLPVREARAYFVERETRARRGADLRPNLAALAAVDDLGYAVLTWNARMVEAVIAWRRGELGAAREILAPLRTGHAVGDLALHELPVACLAVALGVHRDAGRVRALARRVVRQTAPALAVQCLALLAIGRPASRPALRRQAPWSRLPARGREFARMREFLSVRGAAELLGER